MRSTSTRDLSIGVPAFVEVARVGNNCSTSGGKVGRQVIRFLLRLGLSPSWFRPGGNETASPFPQAWLIHIQFPRRGIHPIALDQLRRYSPQLFRQPRSHCMRASPFRPSPPHLLYVVPINRPPRVPSRRRASCPWHTLAVTNDPRHAGLPETHDTPSSWRICTGVTSSVCFGILRSS